MWCCDTDSSCFAGWFVGFRVMRLVVSDLLVSWVSAMQLLSVCGGCGRFPGLRSGRPCGLVRRWSGWGSAAVWWLDLLVRCVGVGFVGLTGFASVWFA